MHHVFDGGWIWVLHFNNGRTSAGVAATDACARELRFTEGAAAWERLLARLPAVREQFAAATATEPFFHSPRLPFLSASVAGPQWALLPSAVGVIDPLLSTGFPLALLGIDRLARILERHGRGDFTGALPAYAAATTGELTLVARYVASLYRAMTDFELFTALALLYFAAASFTETARRLGRTGQTGESFLLADHPEFGPRLRSCIAAALDRPTGDARAQLLDRIREAVALVDVAGLGDVTRRNWFPVQATDLFAAAPKLGASREEIQRMLVRCGLAGAEEERILTADERR
jgi:FADH2 O2-dependent halogenase